MDLVNDWLTQGRDFQAVVANNDEMAIGAAMALKGAGKEKGSVLIAGVDGTPDGLNAVKKGERSEEHTSELQSLMRISYAVFCLKKKKKTKNTTRRNNYKISKTKISCIS